MTGEGAGPTRLLGLVAAVQLTFPGRPRRSRRESGSKLPHSKEASPHAACSRASTLPRPRSRYSIRQARNAATRARALTGAIAPKPACGVESFAVTAGPTGTHDVPSALAWQA